MTLIHPILAFTEMYNLFHYGLCSLAPISTASQISKFCNAHWMDSLPSLCSLDNPLEPWLSCAFFLSIFLLCHYGSSVYLLDNPTLVWWSFSVPFWNQGSDWFPYESFYYGVGHMEKVDISHISKWGINIISSTHGGAYFKEYLSSFSVSS